MHVSSSLWHPSSSGPPSRPSTLTLVFLHSYYLLECSDITSLPPFPHSSSPHVPAISIFLFLFLLLCPVLHIIASLLHLFCSSSILLHILDQILDKRITLTYIVCRLGGQDVFVNQSTWVVCSRHMGTAKHFIHPASRPQSPLHYINSHNCTNQSSWAACCLMFVYHQFTRSTAYSNNRSNLYAVLQNVCMQF